jgi:hypothetical protein
LRLTLETVLEEFIQQYRIDKDQVLMILKKSLVKMQKRFHLVNEEIKNWIKTLVQATIAQIKAQMLLDLVLLSRISEIKAAGNSQ